MICLNIPFLQYLACTRRIFLIIMSFENKSRLWLWYTLGKRSDFVLVQCFLISLEAPRTNNDTNEMSNDCVIQRVCIDRITRVIVSEFGTASYLQQHLPMTYGCYWWNNKNVHSETSLSDIQPLLPLQLKITESV